jgi:hypothetical protein
MRKADHRGSSINSYLYSEDVIMNRTLLFLILLFILKASPGQNTLLVEKVGTGKRYAYHTGDFLKLKTQSARLVLKSFIWDITDTSVMIGRHHNVPLDDIRVVYKKFVFPNRFGNYLLAAGGVYFVITTLNCLINNEPPFPPYNLIITGSFLMVGSILKLVSVKPIHTGLHWKVKVLEIPVL